MRVISNTNCSNNGVNANEASSNSVSSGRCTIEPQYGPGRHQATARIKWSKEINKIMMRCFYKSEPNKRGYRKRILEIWKDIGVFEVTEQR